MRTHLELHPPPREPKPPPINNRREILPYPSAELQHNEPIAHSNRLLPLSVRPKDPPHPAPLHPLGLQGLLPQTLGCTKRGTTSYLPWGGRTLRGSPHRQLELGRGVLCQWGGRLFCEVVEDYSTYKGTNEEKLLLLSSAQYTAKYTLLCPLPHYLQGAFPYI